MISRFPGMFFFGGVVVGSKFLFWLGPTCQNPISLKYMYLVCFFMCRSIHIYLFVYACVYVYIYIYNQRKFG